MILSYSRGSALQKKRLSSAKKMWDTRGLARETRISVIFSWFSAWFRRLTSTSVHKMNMKGDKGSPCRKPHFKIIFPLGWPWNKTWFLSALQNSNIYPIIQSISSCSGQPIAPFTIYREHIYQDSSKRCVTIWFLNHGISRGLRFDVFVGSIGFVLCGRNKFIHNIGLFIILN